MRALHLYRINGMYLSKATESFVSRPFGLKSKLASAIEYAIEKSYECDEHLSHVNLYAKDVLADKYEPIGHAILGVFTPYTSTITKYESESQ